MNKYILEIENLSFSYPQKKEDKKLRNKEGEYKSKELLKDISLKVEEGEIICILGLSGSGKSTLLKLTNRLLEHSIGSILYNGKDIKEYNPLVLRKEISYLPQLPCLVEASVLDNLLLPFEKYHKPDISSLERVLLELGLNGEYLKRDALSLSPGEKQRVSLARSILVKSTRILLLDEPNSSLDEHNSLALIEILKKLAYELAITVIIVTHQSSFAKKVGSKFFILKGYSLLPVSSLEHLVRKLPNKS